MQGEATHTGTPALFVRLQGCAVGCPWCDTKYTWEVDPDRVVSTGEMLAKLDGSPSYAILDADELVDLALTYRARLIVFTGGEPCQYDLREVTERLLDCGRQVQIETSGTQEVLCAPSAWVTLSPKIGMPGGFAVRGDAVRRADEIKMPCGAPRDVEKLHAFLAEHGVEDGRRVWLQPLSRSPKATALCIEAATEHGWRISVQTHAFIGVR
jgi:7-carboxy-7-deazaguanine synthase